MPLNFDMEVLCLLPRYPITAPCRLIVEDLLCDRQQALTEAFVRLRQKGIKIVTQNEAGGRTAAIEPESWQKAQIEGIAYWEEVHGRAA